jgi:hypothetical protein
MKFCCDQLEQDWGLENFSRPNLRIIKIEKNEVPEINHEFPYRFYFTIGYEKGERAVPSRMISYCPYCGTDLYTFYKSDSYVNEIDKTFLKF